MKRYNALIGDLPAKTDQVSVLGTLEDLIRENYLGDVSVSGMNASGLKGYVAGLSDDYARYLTAEEYADYVQTESGVFHGSGLKVRYAASENAFLVTEVSPDSSAFRLGIRAGSRITAVDTQGVTPENREKLTEKLTGPLPQSVQVRYFNGDAAQDVTVTVEKTFRTDAIDTSVENGVGYLRIRGFFESTPDEVRAAVNDLSAQKIAGLVLDLRGSAGFHYAECAKTLDLFVPASADPGAPLFTAVDKNGAVTDTFQATGEAFALPLAVLTDRTTSGAAEIFAAVLQELELAKLVGERTAGVCIVQKAFELESAGAVILPVGRALTHGGEDLDETGLAPDVQRSVSAVVRSHIDDMDLKSDAQFLAAAALLNPAASAPVEEPSEAPSEQASSEDPETTEAEPSEEPEED